MKIFGIRRMSLVENIFFFNSVLKKLRKLYSFISIFYIEIIFILFKNTETFPICMSRTIVRAYHIISNSFSLIVYNTKPNLLQPALRLSTVSFLYSRIL